MGGEEPGEDRSTLRDNPMAITILSEREVMAPPFFYDPYFTTGNAINKLTYTACHWERSEAIS